MNWHLGLKQVRGKALRESGAEEGMYFPPDEQAFTIQLWLSPARGHVSAPELASLSFPDLPTLSPAAARMENKAMYLHTFGERENGSVFEEPFEGQNLSKLNLCEDGESRTPHPGPRGLPALWEMGLGLCPPLPPALQSPHAELVPGRVLQCSPKELGVRLDAPSRVRGAGTWGSSSRTPSIPRFSWGHMSQPSWSKGPLLGEGGAGEAGGERCQQGGGRVPWPLQLKHMSCSWCVWPGWTAWEALSAHLARGCSCWWLQPGPEVRASFELFAAALGVPPAAPASRALALPSVELGHA